MRGAPAAPAGRSTPHEPRRNEAELRCRLSGHSPGRVRGRIRAERRRRRGPDRNNRSGREQGRCIRAGCRCNSRAGEAESTPPRWPLRRSPRKRWIRRAVDYSTPWVLEAARRRCTQLRGVRIAPADRMSCRLPRARRRRLARSRRHRWTGRSTGTGLAADRSNCPERPRNTRRSSAEVRSPT